ncbi:MAG: hypothetical protein P0120_18460 [Nitrospira sp.]|nr:hypothetical protein [Nitrospira sp.]
MLLEIENKTLVAQRAIYIYKSTFTDETVKVCVYNFSESAFLHAKQAIIRLTLRTI